MFKNRQIVSFLLTLFLYLGIVFSILYYKNIHVETAQKVEEKTISFSLSEYTPEVTPPVEEVKEETIESEPVEEVKEETIEPEPIEPEPVEEVKEETIEPEPTKKEEKVEPEVVKELPKPIVKKIVKPKKKTKRKKKIKKKYRKKSVIKKRVKVNKKSVSKKKLSKKRNTKKVTKQKVSPPRQFSAAKKNAFLSQIRIRINSNKSYPRIAQRRGMQGSIHVSFVLKANGNVGNISVKGPKVFHTSARNAVKRAFPINVKNAPLSLPTTVNLTLRYQIR